MKGEKKCLPVGFQTGFNLNYFRKGETLNKAYKSMEDINEPNNKIRIKASYILKN